MRVPTTIGRRRWTAVAALLVVLAWNATPASAATEYQTGEEFDESSIADGYDYSYQWNGSSWTQLSRGGLGSLATGTAAAGAAAPNNMTLLKTVCFAWPNSNPNVAGRHASRSSSRRPAMGIPTTTTGSGG